jgi:DNA-binding transcriptional MerR regulator
LQDTGFGEHLTLSTCRLHYMSQHISTRRTLSIGEFAAATQLTPKALRLYDEQQLLRPITTSVTGYRLYGADQVSTGRTIRALRDMNLSLQQIAKLLNTEGLATELLLRTYLTEADQRYARERRAFQAALMLLRKGSHGSPVSIVERLVPERTVVVRSFQARQALFPSTFIAACDLARAELKAAGLQVLDHFACTLSEPLGDEDSTFELLVSVAAADHMQTDTRIVPERRYGSVELVSLDTQIITGAIDALFDWFDQRGATVMDVPLISSRGESSWEALWAFK